MSDSDEVTGGIELAFMEAQKLRKMKPYQQKIKLKLDNTVLLQKEGKKQSIAMDLAIDMEKKCKRFQGFIIMCPLILVCCQ